ncbi:MAG: YvcK family protein, partial [Deltaproteobacteria bacterium]|nr:YvcK family protein [Deltaproteobacteria bacterium]
MKRSELGQYVDNLLETVINRTAPKGTYRNSVSNLAQEIRASEYRDIRIVIFGGGTGLSTVLGGNSRLDDWPDNPFVGLKQEFPHLNVVVCTTDDGGSTGLLLRQLPIMGIGDIRKVLLSLVLSENLQKTYSLDELSVRQVIRVIHGIFNHRFREGSRDYRCVTNPLLAIPPSLRECCPASLNELLSSLGEYISPTGKGPTISPGEHCLGNLLLTAAIFRSAEETGIYPPDSRTITEGINTLSRSIGVTPGIVHPATATPGQLILKYSNGVAVRGQSKASVTQRLLPIDRLYVECCEIPHVSEDILRAIKEADIILFAPGSLYTSIMPILKLAP